MMHWLFFKIWKMFSRVSWCTDVSFRSKQGSPMCMMPWFSCVWKMFTNVGMLQWLLLRCEQKALMCHVALTSLEIWKNFTNMSWCADVLLNVLLKSGKSSQMCHVALTSREIWKRFANVSWCTSFLLRSGKCLLACHDALAFFRDLENCHSCVMMHWLFLGSQKNTNVPWSWWTDFLVAGKCSQMLACCSDFSWDLNRKSLMCHVALTSLEIWKISLMCHDALIFFWGRDVSWCTDFLWRSETCSRMCHGALTFSWDRDNAH